jgi:hypothetical protein
MNKREQKKIFMDFTKAELVEIHMALRNSLIYFHEHGNARLRTDIEAITTRAAIRKRKAGEVNHGRQRQRSVAADGGGIYHRPQKG